MKKAKIELIILGLILSISFALGANYAFARARQTPLCTSPSIPHQGQILESSLYGGTRMVPVSIGGRLPGVAKTNHLHTQNGGQNDMIQAMYKFVFNNILTIHGYILPFDVQLHTQP